MDPSQKILELVKLKRNYLLSKHIRYGLKKSQLGYKHMTLDQIRQAQIKPNKSKSTKTIPEIRDVFNTCHMEGPNFDNTFNHELIARLYSQSK